MQLDHLLATERGAKIFQDIECQKYQIQGRQVCSNIVGSGSKGSEYALYFYFLNFKLLTSNASKLPEP